MVAPVVAPMNELDPPVHLLDIDSTVRRHDIKLWLTVGPTILPLSNQGVTDRLPR